MVKNKELTTLQDEADSIETLPEIEIKEPESAADSNSKSLDFERLESIVGRLERIEIKPEIEIKEPESKSKVGLIVFILIFAIGIGGYFTLKQGKKA